MEILIQEIPYTEHIRSIFNHFGLECQRLKLVSEILELHKELITANQTLVRIKQMCLNRVMPICDLDYLEDLHEDIENTLENIHREIADVCLIIMQIKEYNFDEAFDICLRKNKKYLDELEKNEHPINKMYVFERLLKNIENTINTKEEYNNITGIKNSKKYQRFL